MLAAAERALGLSPASLEEEEEEEGEEVKEEEEEARARAAEGTREGLEGAGSARAGAPERARRCCRPGAAGGGGWRAQLATSPDTLGSVPAGVRAARPESGKEMLVASFGKPYIFMEQCSVKVL